MRLCRHRKARSSPRLDTLGPLLESLRFEVLPLTDVLDQTARLPEETTVTVTASASYGLEATVALCEKLAAQRLYAVPHLAARQVRDTVHLRDLLDRLAGAQIDEVFVVAGDVTPPAGPFADGLSLLREMEESGRRPRRVGIPCYPEGHPKIPDERLWTALDAKREHADYAVSQLCFDATVVCRFLRDMHDHRVRLPVMVGLAGTVDPATLLRIGSRIGVGDSLAFLRKNRSMVRTLAGPRRYRPSRFLAELDAHVADGGCAPAGLHFYTFNRLTPTAEWVAEVAARHVE